MESHFCYLSIFFCETPSLLSVNLPGFRRGDPTWSPVNGKNFISMPSSLARDQLCSLRGFAPYDRFFLYPTKA